MRADCGQRIQRSAHGRWSRRQPEGAAVDLCHLRGYRVYAARRQEPLLQVLRRVPCPLGLIP